jgi:hypothetical protein
MRSEASNSAASDLLFEGVRDLEVETFFREVCGAGGELPTEE